MEKSKRYQFKINTLNWCFLCFKDKNDDEENGESICKNEDKQFSLKAHSIQNLCRYINMDLSKMKSISQKLLPLLSKTDVRVSLCEKCGNTFKSFSRLFMEYEVIRMQLEPFVQSVNKILTNTGIESTVFKQLSEDEHSVRHLRMIQELRLSLEEKCKHKIQSSSPRVRLEKIQSKLYNLTPQPQQPQSIFDVVASHNMNTDNLDEKKSVGHIKCPSCDVFAPSHRDLQVHQEAQHVSDHICQRCDSFFDKPEILHRHNQRCKGRPSSGKWSIRMVDFKELGISEWSSKRLQCDQCAKCFTTKTTLISHKWTHMGQYPYKCNVCGYRFRQWSNMLRHRNCHFVKDSTSSIITVKKKIGSGLRSNVKSSSLDGVDVTASSMYKKFNCGLCGKYFRTNDEVQCHERVHTNQRPYKCPYCTLSFKQRGHRLRHIERKHRLSKGGGGTKCQLKIEQETVSVNTVSLSDDRDTEWTRTNSYYNKMTKRFSCEFCSKAFKLKSDLILHRRTHMSARM